MKKYFLVILVLLLSSCSRKTDEQLFKEGQQAQGQKDFLLAVDRYQELVDKYPKSSHADSAQFLTALIYNNDLREMEKAVKAYQQVYTKFPQSQMAPTAMFLVAFLFNNELHQLDSARNLYYTFLQQYHTHELAPSAKFELESLGKDPSQLISQDVLAKVATDSSKQEKTQVIPKKKKR